MKRRQVIDALVGTAVLLGATPASGAGSRAKTWERVARARRGMRTMVATFEQVRRIGLLSTDVRSRGELTLVAPDRLRWELLPPDAMTYWVGPEGVSFAGGTAREHARRGAAGAMGRVLDDWLQLLAGDPSSLEDRYRVRVTPTDGGAVTIEARPRDRALRRVLRRFELTLGPDARTPQRVAIEESDVDHVRIRFTHVDFDVPVDPARMQPPAS